MKIHIDIDCFFVSAIRIGEPELEHKAVAVGGRSDTKIFDPEAKNQEVDFTNKGNFVPTFYKRYDKSDDDLGSFIDANGRIRGVITTSSYEARKYGVKTAMSIAEALRLCPELIVRAPNMSLYQKLSHELHTFLSAKIPLVEQASIDEFYGDLSGWVEEDDIAQFIDQLRVEIKQELKLPVSIGAAPTRYIAKLATNHAKPFGSLVITPQNFSKYVDPLDVASFSGIGKSMQRKLQSARITTLGEIRKRRGTLYSWGPYAQEIYKRVNGESDAPIDVKQKRKSIGISRTFDVIYSRKEVRRRVHVLARHLAFGVYKLRVIPTTFTLSIGYELGQKSHVRYGSSEIFIEKRLHHIVQKLFDEADTQHRLGIIRLSINCSSFTKDTHKTLALDGFDEFYDLKDLGECTFALRQRYGLDVIKWGSELC